MSTTPIEEASEDVRDISRYASLGLFANPFSGVVNQSEPGVECEIQAAGNRLLQAILAARDEEAPLPIWVDKDGDIPSSYPLFAVAHAERTLAVDDTFNVLYSYVQLFMFKIGSVRAVLGVLAERLAFRDFERTLVPYVRKVLASPDESLASYAVMSPKLLEAFAAELEADELAAVRRVFGEPEIERHQEFIEIADMRKLDLEDDGEEGDASEEIDETVGDAPGSTLIFAERADEPEVGDARALLDYFIEYTRVHLTPVLARGMRLYRERGMSALGEELKITKAPRKTIAKLIEFASVRFEKTAVIYDEFESWLDVPDELRNDVADSMVNLRWKLAGPAVMVYLFAPGEVPELEERMDAGRRVPWKFENLPSIQDNPTAISDKVVNDWLASAALPGADPLTIGAPAFARLAEAAEGQLPRFIALSHAAIEDAAARGALSVDDAAVDAALGR